MAVGGRDRQAGRENRPGGSASDPPRGTLVVLDDDAIFRAGLLRAFRAEGFVVIEAPDVSTLLHTLETAPVDVILADSRLSDGSDGWREARALASRFRHVRVVAMSGYTPDVIAADGGVVADRYVLKGQSFLHFLEAVEEVLRS